MENVVIELPSEPASPKSKTSSSSLSPTSVKVIDFDTVDEAHRSQYSHEVVGTDGYISQEAYAGRYSPSSDIFAIGVVAYKLLCRKLPFDKTHFGGDEKVSSPKMIAAREKLQKAQADFSKAVFEKNPLAADLIKSMLSHSQSSRPAADAALQHPWFQEAEKVFFSQEAEEVVMDEDLMDVAEEGSMAKQQVYHLCPSTVDKYQSYFCHDDRSKRALADS